MKVLSVVVIAIVCLLVGTFVGGKMILGTSAGLGVGAGLIVGSQAGVCLAVETAKEQGLLSVEQIDQLIKNTVTKIRAKSNISETAEFKWLGSEKDCAAMVAKIAESTK